MAEENPTEPGASGKTGSLNRREALWLLAGASGLLSSTANLHAQAEHTSPRSANSAPAIEGPSRQAALEWFRNAKFGLFMHYGLYSQLGRGEWVMLREKVPLAQYERLKDSFHPDKFDANHIASVAVDAGMKYVNLTSKHHEGFCLFRTRQTSYNSTESPSRRDLVGELAEACGKHGLGLFLYYSMGADWHHPCFCDPSAGWEYYRPAYATKPAQYLWKKDSDFRIYIDYVHQQLRELLTQYGPVAGIWFDPVVGYYARPDLFPMDQTYALIRSLQPNCLVSFKQGATGNEDFAAPERSDAGLLSYASVVPERRQKAQETEENAWAKNRTKPAELCNTLQPGVWGYNRSDDSKHRTAPEVLDLYKQARAQNANLLLNTGLLPDGSIFPEDVKTLRSVGTTLKV
jgi:alpha-L-fucosidase